MICLDCDTVNVDCESWNRAPSFKCNRLFPISSSVFTYICVSAARRRSGGQKSFRSVIWLLPIHLSRSAGSQFRSFRHLCFKPKSISFQSLFCAESSKNYKMLTFGLANENR